MADQEEERQKSVASLLTRSDLSVVTIKYGEHEFNGHRVVLASRSEYFNKLLFSPFQERDASTIELKDDDETTLQVMFRWIYDNETDLKTYDKMAFKMADGFSWSQSSFQKLHSLYVVADKYNVTGLANEALKLIIAGAGKMTHLEFVVYLEVIYSTELPYTEQLLQAIQSKVKGLSYYLVGIPAFDTLLSHNDDFAQAFLLHNPEVVYRYACRDGTIPNGIINVLTNVDGLAYRVLKSLVESKRSSSRPRDRLVDLMESPSFKFREGCQRRQDHGNQHAEARVLELNEDRIRRRMQIRGRCAT